MKRSLVLFVALLLAGCHKDLVPFIGKWNGGFVIDASRKGGKVDSKRENLNGFLQLYATEQRFTMHLDGMQEAVDVTGNWSHQGRRITLKVLDVKVDDEGGEDNRSASLPFIAADDLKQAYARPVVLDLSADGTKLMGLRTSMGDRIGHHEFEKVKMP